MTLYEFKMLNDAQQAEVLWDKGIYLMNRFEDGFTINLHGLYDFYVEVWYDPQTNRIVKFRTFKSKGPLEPYLDRIKLGE